jgi:hypothetical protein
MTAEFLRDAAATAAVFGFFAARRNALVAGSAVSLLTAVGGGLLAALYSTVSALLWT